MKLTPAPASLDNISKTCLLTDCVISVGRLISKRPCEMSLTSEAHTQDILKTNK